MRKQHGAALILMLAIVVLGIAWMLTRELNAGNRQVALKRSHNAEVLNEAKRALIGHVIRRAALAGENNPGRLPCPEAVNNIGVTNLEGISAPYIGPPATPSCATVGRLPWRTLGIDKLVDAASEPLWFVVSPGWRLQNSSTTLVINSDKLGQLVVDGNAAPNEVIALIIAPGPPMKVEAAAGCTARDQARSAPAPSMDPLDYVECFNAATSTFSTTGPGASFNDQVVRITTGDLLPGIEAAIAARIEREIAPALKSMYASADWGLTAANPLFPFADTFTDPGTSNYRGRNASEGGTYQGLLPMTSSAASCGASARCSTSFVGWNGGFQVSQTGGVGAILGSSCSIGGPNATRASCTGTYAGAIQMRMRVQMDNVAKALRQLDPSQVTMEYQLLLGDPWVQVPATATGQFKNDGSGDAYIFVEGSMPDILVGGVPALSIYFRISAEQEVVADHSLLDPADAITGWFVRNEWYKVIYYAAAEGATVDGLTALNCVTAGCITVNSLRVSPADKKRAILILAGRSLTGAGRPNSTLSDYLDSSQNHDGGTTYEQKTISKAKSAAFNDRVIIVDVNP